MDTQYNRNVDWCNIAHKAALIKEQIFGHNRLFSFFGFLIHPQTTVFRSKLIPSLKCCHPIIVIIIIIILIF